MNKIFFLITLSMSLQACTYQQKEKICIDAESYSFSKIYLEHCGSTQIFNKIERNIWSGPNDLIIGNCQDLDYKGVLISGEDVVIAELYHLAHMSGKQTRVYKIVDLENESLSKRVTLTAFSNHEILPCTSPDLSPFYPE